MFNIQNISNRNLSCVLNIYAINKHKTRIYVLYAEQYYVKSVQYIEHLLSYHKAQTRHEVVEDSSVTLNIDYLQNGNSCNNTEQFTLFILGFCMIKNLLYVV